MKRTIIPILVIIVLGLWGIRALLLEGFYTSHDGEHHLARMANYSLALKSGQLPPRWAPNFSGHLGSPIFVFIYPLPYILGVALHSFNFTFADAFKAAIGGSYLLSGVFFYLWLKPKLGSLPALVGALFYLWAPYRFLMIFVRGAYPESLAYTFVPLLFWIVDRISESKDRRYIGLGAIITALLLLSQNLVAFIFLPLAGVYTAFKYLRGINKSALARLIVMMLLGLSISAFIYLPDVFELKFTQYSRLMNYSQANFVFLWQLLRSPWGYGFSLSGPNDGLSFQIGLTQLLVIVAAAALAFFLLLANHKGSLKESKNFPLLPFSFLTFILAVVLMTDSPLARFVWAVIPQLKMIDYPWRLLGITVFTSALIAGWFIFALPDKLKKIAAVLLIISLLLANRNFLRINQRLDLSDKYLLSFSGRDTHLGEFTPQGRITVNPFPGSSPAEFYDGGGTVVARKVSPTYQRYDVSVMPKVGLSKFRINTLYFPGWRTFVDGKEVFVGKGMEVTGGIDLKTNVDTSGMIGVMLNSGKHQVETKFTETNIRLLSDFVSVAALIGSAGVLIL